MLASLDHEIPLPLVALFLGVCMWALATVSPHLAVPSTYRWPLLIVIVLAGAAFILAAAAQKYGRAVNFQSTKRS